MTIFLGAIAPRLKALPPIHPRSSERPGIRAVGDKLIVGYPSRKDNVDCVGEACTLNEDRFPIEMHSIPEDGCHNPIDCITVTVKTKNRYGPLTDFCESLHIYYPGMRIMVADEIVEHFWAEHASEHFERWQQFLTNNSALVTYIQLGPGVGYGRKVAAMLSATKYVLIADDDFLISRKTNLSKMLQLLESSDASIVGSVIDGNQKFDGVFRVTTRAGLKTGAAHSILSHYPRTFYEEVPRFPNCFVADRVKNFFLAKRTAILDAGSWDVNRRYNEHTDFFVQMRKSRLKTVLCSDTSFVHNVQDRSLRRLRRPMNVSLHVHFLVKWKLWAMFDCKAADYAVDGTGIVKRCKLHAVVQKQKPVS